MPVRAAHRGQRRSSRRLSEALGSLLVLYAADTDIGH